MIVTNWLRLFHWPLVAAGHFSIRPAFRTEKVMLIRITCLREGRDTRALSWELVRAW